MTNIDILEKIVTPLIAAFVGAVLAFRYRNVGANELDFIKMLNATDVVYHDNKEVRDLLHTYFAQTVRPIFESGQYVETFYRLVFAMAKDCGYNNLSMNDIRDFYAPEALLIHYPNTHTATVPAVPLPAPPDSSSNP